MKRLWSLLLLCFLTLTPLWASETATPADSSWVDRVEDWYGRHMNYATVTALMAVESSFIPFPSEIIIPPAAYVAVDGDSDMTIPGIVLFGTLGALIGAFVNYLLALWLGRPVIYAFADSRAGRLLLLSGEKIQKAEAYFNAHGKVSTLVGRLIPGIRQLISIPAGLARMPLGAFTLYTCLGAALWNVVLALLGYLAHGSKDLIHRYSSELSAVLVAITVLFLIYLTVKYVVRKKKKSAGR